MVSEKKTFNIILPLGLGLGLWCLTPLLTIFQILPLDMLYVTCLGCGGHLGFAINTKKH